MGTPSSPIALELLVCRIAAESSGSVAGFNAKLDEQTVTGRGIRCSAAKSLLTSERSSAATRAPTEDKYSLKASARSGPSAEESP